MAMKWVVYITQNIAGLHNLEHVWSYIIWNIFGLHNLEYFSILFYVDRSTLPCLFGLISIFQFFVNRLLQVFFLTFFKGS